MAISIVHELPDINPTDTERLDIKVNDMSFGTVSKLLSMFDDDSGVSTLQVRSHGRAMIQGLTVHPQGGGAPERYGEDDLDDVHWTLVSAAIGAVFRFLLEEALGLSNRNRVHSKSDSRGGTTPETAS